MKEASKSLIGLVSGSRNPISVVASSSSSSTSTSFGVETKLSNWKQNEGGGDVNGFVRQELRLMNLQLKGKHGKERDWEVA